MAKTRKELQHNTSFFMGSSVVLHLIALFLIAVFHSCGSIEIPEEVEIEIDMMADFEDTAVDKISEKTTKAAPSKVSIDKKMLPQLPKHLTVKKEEKGEVQKKETDKKVDKDSGDKDKTNDETVDVKDDDNSNKITQKDLKKRAAIERLRKLKDKKPAEDLDKIRRLAELNEKMTSEIDAAAKLGDVSSRKKCKTLVNKAVRQHYVIPETYGFGASELKVTIRVIINAQGDVMETTTHKSSGDIVFDDLTKQAVLAAAPFPVACKQFAGEAMDLNFNSNQF